MKKIMVSLILLSFMVLFAVVSPASAAYTPEQQATLEGTRLSFQLGQAYQQANQGQNIAGFNALVDQWNAWVVANFGQDANLLMQKMTAPMDLQKPYAVGTNTTNKGIVHSIDGSAQYTTNDINLLPDWAIASYQNSETGQIMGDGYLGGV